MAQLVATLKGHESAVVGLAFSPNSQLLASACRDKTIKLWDVHKKVLLCEFVHPDDVESVCFSPDGSRLCSGSWDASVRIWDVNTTKQQYLLNGHTEHVKSVAWSSDNTLIASGGEDNSICLWNPNSGNHLRTLQHTNIVCSVTFSSSGRFLLSGSVDDTVRMWDPRSGKELHQFTDDQVMSAVLSSDEQMVITTGYDGSLRLWNAFTDVQIHQFDGHTDQVHSAAFSPDGAFVVSGSDRTVRIWDVRAKKQLHLLEVNASWVACVGVSSDGRFIASGDSDKIVSIWSAPWPETYQITIHYSLEAAMTVDAPVLDPALNECPVCQELLTDSAQLLPCLHIICASCVQDIRTHRATCTKCCLCHEPFEHTQSWNQSINSCAEHASPLISRCVPCQQFLCAQCNHPGGHERLSLDQVLAQFHSNHVASTAVLQTRLEDIDAHLARSRALQHEISARLRTTPATIAAFYVDKIKLTERKDEFISAVTTELTAALKTTQLQYDAVTMLRDQYLAAIFQNDVIASQPLSHLRSMAAVAGRLEHFASTTLFLEHLIDHLPVFVPDAGMSGFLSTGRIVFSQHDPIHCSVQNTANWSNE